MYEIRKEKRNPEKLQVLLSRMAEPLVPTENSVCSMADVFSPNEPKARAVQRFAPCLSLVNEIRQCAGATLHADFQTAMHSHCPAWQIRALLGSPSFVAVVQSADLWQRQSRGTVVLLREFQGLTNEEIAQHLGLTVALLKHGSSMQGAGSGVDWNENSGRQEMAF